MKSADYFSSNPADRTRLLTNCSKCTRLQQFSTAMDHSVGNDWNQHTQVQQLTRILRYGIQKESWLQYSHNRWRAIVTFGIVCKIRSSFIRPPAIFMTHSPNDIPETEADLISAQFSCKSTTLKRLLLATYNSDCMHYCCNGTFPDVLITLLLTKNIYLSKRLIILDSDWYTGCWWVGCCMWYSPPINS